MTPVTTPRPIHFLDASDIDPPLFSLPLSPLTKTVARKSKSFKQKSFDGALCDKPYTSALQNKIDEPSTSTNPPDLKTASDLSTETFSLLFPKLSSSLYSTSSVDDFLNYESQDSWSKTLTSSTQRVLILIIWDQDRYKHRLPLVEDQRQVQFFYCVNTHYLIHLLKIFLPLSLTKLNTVHTGVLTYQSNIYGWITSTHISHFKIKMLSWSKISYR